MKKQSKCDFKKLALLGVTGGTMLASQAIATDLNNYSQLLALNGCGGSNAGCGSKGVGGGSSGGYSAYRNVPSSNYYYQDNGQAQANYSDANAQWQSTQPVSHCSSPSHCNGQSGQYYQSYPSYPSASCQAYAPQYYQQQQSYYQQPAQSYYQQQPSQPSQGCASYTTPSYSAAQPSHSCGGMSQTNWMQANSQPGSMPTQPGTSPTQPGTPPAQPGTPEASAWNKKTYSSWEPAKLTADTAKPAAQRPLTENELLSQLNDQAKTTYQSLDASGKALALQLANQTCKGQNKCKGMNSCKTEEHACAGKGSCAGTAASNFKDKNLAVKVAALKMAEKRVKATSSKY